VNADAKSGVKKRRGLLSYRVRWWGLATVLLLLPIGLLTQHASVLSWSMAVFVFLVFVAFPVSFLAYYIVRSVRVATIVFSITTAGLAVLLVSTHVSRIGEEDPLDTAQQQLAEALRTRDAHRTEFARLYQLADGNDYFSVEHERLTRHLVEGSSNYASPTSKNRWAIANMSAELEWIPSAREAQGLRVSEALRGTLIRTHFDSLKHLQAHIERVTKLAEAWRDVASDLRESTIVYRAAMRDPILADHAPTALSRHEQYVQAAAARAEAIAEVADRAARALGYFERLWGRWECDHDEGRIMFDETVLQAAIDDYNALAVGIDEAEHAAFEAFFDETRAWMRWLEDNAPGPPADPDEP